MIPGLERKSVESKCLLNEQERFSQLGWRRQGEISFLFFVTLTLVMYNVKASFSEIKQAKSEKVAS